MRQKLRSIYIWTAVIVGTAIMYFAQLPIFLITVPFDKTRRFGHWYSTLWGRLILRLNNRWSWEVHHGERIPRGRPVVMVSNHQSMGDIMMAFCLDIHFKWISKAVNFYVPFMGWFMSHAGYIPLRRGNKNSIKECMDKARWWLQQGVSILMFPEGTRSKDGALLPFKPGAFKLAIETGADILPIAIAGTKQALPNATWQFSEERVTMKVAVGEPISVKGLGDRDVRSLIEASQNCVTALLLELQGKSASQSIVTSGRSPTIPPLPLPRFLRPTDSFWDSQLPPTA